MEWKNKTKKTQPFWSFIFGLSLPLLVTIITFAKKGFFYAESSASLSMENMKNRSAGPIWQKYSCK